MKLQKIVVIGTGYVGLPAAILLARAGHDVVGVDINDNIVRAINEGVLHINEKELQAVMEEEEVRKNLRAQSTPCEADAYFIAVPTPLDERKKIADMSYVISAAESILPHLREGNLVVLESTVPPLTCREVLTPILEKSGLKVGENLHLAHCPERILPGNVFHEIVHNDRLIGAKDAKSRELAAEVYSTFVSGQLFQTDDVTAELCKLMENTYRDVNVALANELSAVCDTLEISAKEAITLANRHPRVNILFPGIGVGGHCIPIDPWFIKEVDPMNSRLIFTSRMINDEQPYRIAAKIRKAVKNVNTPRIVAIGATYKPDTEDTRESPAIEIVDILKSDGYSIEHFDPLVPEMKYESLESIVEGADCLTILVPHKEVISELERSSDAISDKMRTPIVLRF